MRRAGIVALRIGQIDRTDRDQPFSATGEIAIGQN
jgi:hypothetical protein